MSWINPMDKVPQLRQDWGNHLFYGGLLTWACLLVGANHWSAMAITLGVSCAKKIADYVLAHEDWKICVSKGVLTPFWAYALLVADHLPVRWSLV